MNIELDVVVCLVKILDVNFFLLGGGVISSGGIISCSLFWCGFLLQISSSGSRLFGRSFFSAFSSSVVSRCFLLFRFVLVPLDDPDFVELGPQSFLQLVSVLWL